MSDLWSDPAIVNASSSSVATSTHATSDMTSATPQKSALEPGNALSKLLDSAMANAAKEKTPDFDPKPDPDLVSALSTSRSSFLSTIPPTKSLHARIYTIETLLQLRNDPAVALFDQSRLPGHGFWATRLRAPENAAGGKHSGSHGLNSRKNRRGGNSGHSAANQTDSLKWERKPAGFLKQSELDGMSSEKISQLLGEAPDEGAPEWDSPGASAASKIDMGNTVEDFERWKQSMRQEDRRKRGEDDFQTMEHGEAHQSNEVDSFFSFVKPKDLVPEKANLPALKQSDLKSSRFSSFFSPPLATGTPQESTTQLSSKRPSVSDSRSTSKSDVSSNLRFFGSEQAQTPVQSAQQPVANSLPPQVAKPQPLRAQNGPPPGIHQKYNQYAPNNDFASGGFQGGSMPPPGFGPPGGLPNFGHAGPMGMNPKTNDSFFLSLLNRGDAELPGIAPLLQGLPAPVPDKAANRGLMDAGKAFPGKNVSGPPAPQGAPKPMQHPYFAQQPPPMQFSPGMRAPPGMQFPPGMQYPPGMFHPGMVPGGRNGQLQPNQNSTQGGSEPTNAGPAQNGLTQGELPPWMRFDPRMQQNAQGVRYNSGYPQMPPGFAPEFQKK